MGNDEVSPSIMEKLYTSLIKSRENLVGRKKFFTSLRPWFVNYLILDHLQWLKWLPSFQLSSFQLSESSRVVADTPVASDEIAPYQGNNYDGFMFLGVVVNLFRFIIWIVLRALQLCRDYLHNVFNFSAVTVSKLTCIIRWTTDGGLFYQPTRKKI